MTENSIVRQFNQAKIEQRVTDGYINLNQMAKATEKRIDNWLQNRSTQELLTEFNNQKINYLEFQVVYLSLSSRLKDAAVAPGHTLTSRFSLPNGAVRRLPFRSVAGCGSG